MLALALLFVTVDEVTTIHEGLDQVLFEMTGGDAFLTFLWVLPYGIGALVLGMMYIPFLRRLPRDVGSRIFLGGVLFVAGAVGLEIVGSEVFDRYGFGSTAFYLVAGVEEGLELTGSALAVLGMLRHVGSTPLRVTVASGVGRPAARVPEHEGA